MLLRYPCDAWRSRPPADSGLSALRPGRHASKLGVGTRRRGDRSKATTAGGGLRAKDPPSSRWALVVEFQPTPADGCHFVCRLPMLAGPDTYNTRLRRTADQSRSLGAARWPLTAVAAATSGETRWVRAPGPWRPSKLRFDVEAQRAPGGDPIGVHSQAHGAAGVAPFGPGPTEHLVELFPFGLGAHAVAGGCRTPWPTQTAVARTPRKRLIRRACPRFPVG
jgi:hypothetical protein